MSLTSGTRLGPYEIQAAIGTGGMGEVYPARDTRLKRDVALKILPESFAADPDRLARFQREAEVLASLSHSNIAAIHGLEESSGTRALVMELVEGPTLADRITHGPIPIEEALPIARQIAEALETAHDQNIVHRDLKPANIKLRPDGTVKVLDFGLAKALGPPAAGRDFSPAGSRDQAYTQSPTITSPAMMTGVGMLLGTAAYMSPEQARGRAVDQRSDIWAFGCVLYEMLTGKRAFAGDDVTDTLAFIITKEPDWNVLPATTPIALRRLLRHCLEKDRGRRLRHIGDAHLAIDDALAAPAAVLATDVRPTSSGIQRAGWRRVLPWGLAGALTAAFAVVVVLWAPWRTLAPLAPVRLEAGPGAAVSLDRLNASLAVSPDGSLLVFSGRSGDGNQQLYIRRLGELEAIPLQGTSNARDPFFSPDGQWIGFFADSSLKKIAVTGGAAVALSAAGDDRGGWWAEDGFIVFQPSGSGAGLSRVSSAGGTPETVTKLGPGEVTHRWPQVLPGGRAILYTAHSTIADFDNAVIVVQPLPDGAPKVVQRGGYYGRYLRSGHLVYMHQGTLFAEPFDLARLEPTGQPVPVIEGVSTYTGLTGVGGQAGSAQAAWTETGTAVYLAGSNEIDQVPIDWMDRTGTVAPLHASPASWSNPQFSQDGRRLAADILAGQRDLFTYDWARDTLTRVTFGGGLNTKPVWTFDGQRLVFRSTRNGVFNLYWQRADGSGDVQRLTESPNPQFTGSWHQSGKFLAFYEARIATGNDLMILPMEGEEASGWKPGKPTVFLSTPFNEQEPMFSPDGRWIAYFSNESGRAEVYVRPFPGPGGRWQISIDGGTFPTWSRKSQELFYASPDDRLMVASYTVNGDSFKADRPRRWSERRFIRRPGRPFDLHPDGERFALAAAPENDASVKQDTLVFIFNFYDELRRVAPVAGQ